jgi:hypothetical protein
MDTQVTPRRATTAIVALRLLSLLCILAGWLLFSAHTTQAQTSWTPTNGADLQSILQYSVQPGDTIYLMPGVTYGLSAGPITLYNRDNGNPGNSSWITIRPTQDLVLPAPGQRMTPYYNLPKIVGDPYGSGALRINADAHHYRIVGIEFTPNNSGTGPDQNLVELGQQSVPNPQPPGTNARAHHIILDQCYIHPFAGQQYKRGVALNGAYEMVLNSYISGFIRAGQDAQAICGWDGPGPFQIINNYLEATGENILFGGAISYIPNLIPSDIEIRGNTLAKNPAWQGLGYTVKNLFELKNAQRVLIDGNVLQYNWGNEGQSGSAVLFTPRSEGGAMPWVVVQDVQFTNNILSHSGTGFNIAGFDVDDNGHQLSTRRTSRILIENNLISDLNSTYAGSGNAVQFILVAGTDRLTVNHNTVIQTGGPIILAYDSPSSPGDSPCNGYINDYGKVSNFVYTNNLNLGSSYGLLGDCRGEGQDSLNVFFSGYTLTGNLLDGRPSYVYPASNIFSFDSSCYNDPAHNNSDYSQHCYTDADGSYVGYDINALNNEKNLPSFSAFSNPIDNASFFVRQHYIDFLGRRPDAGGLQYWTNNITSCGSDANCTAVQRVNTSRAFFQSIEFQNTGFVAFRFYKASFGLNDQPAAGAAPAATAPAGGPFPVPLSLKDELLQAQRRIGWGVVVGSSNWTQQLQTNKLSFANDWVSRLDFQTVHGSQSNPDYVNSLFANAGVTPSAADLNALINGLNNGTESRATVLLKIADDSQTDANGNKYAYAQTFYSQEYKPAYVLLEYIGYLRRNPQDPPDHDFSGYQYWLNVFNSSGDDFQMTNAFISSFEYRSRFGQS